MDFAATRNATTNAWRVARRKRVAVSMGYADRLRMTRTRTMTVLMVHVMGKTNVRITMVLRVRRRRNAYQIIASTVSVAAIFAWGLVKRVVRRKRAAEAMEFAAISRRILIPIMNAIPANAMDRAHAMRVLNRKQPMGRRVRRLLNARLVIARMECVAIAGV